MYTFIKEPVCDTVDDDDDHHDDDDNRHRHFKTPRRVYAGGVKM